MKSSPTAHPVASTLVLPTPTPHSDRPDTERELRVLVVDDDRDAADTLGFLVRHWGHRAFVAYDPEAALELARECEPDVALLDVGLPGFDGVELARRLVEQAPARRVLMVAISGQANVEKQPEWREEGLLFFLVKPVDPGLIEDLLRGHKASLSVRPGGSTGTSPQDPG